MLVAFTGLLVSTTIVTSVSLSNQLLYHLDAKALYGLMS